MFFWLPNTFPDPLSSFSFIITIYGFFLVGFKKGIYSLSQRQPPYGGNRKRGRRATIKWKAGQQQEQSWTLQRTSHSILRMNSCVSLILQRQKVRFWKECSCSRVNRKSFHSSELVSILLTLHHLPTQGFKTAWENIMSPHSPYLLGCGSLKMHVHSNLDVKK